MQQIKFSTWILAVLAFAVACKKKDIDIFPVHTNQTIKISYTVDSMPLLFDTILYHNAAGNNYEVTRLEYYISNITFHALSGKNYTSPGIYYVNAKMPSTNAIMINSVPHGHYSHITLDIGLDSAHNLTGFLPNTAENVNMAWPVSMGGGYHFMKFEGHYVHSPSTSGFAVHLGKNPNLVKCLINSSINVGYQHPYEVHLNMNLNEWFENPNTYNLETDGSYTMSNMMAMKKIASNGNDVFKLK